MFDKVVKVVGKVWFVVLGFNATLTAKVILWQSVMHMCFLAFSHQYQHNFPSKAIDYFSHILQQRREAKTGLKESSPQQDLELTTTRSDRLSTESPGGVVGKGENTHYAHSLFFLYVEEFGTDLSSNKSTICMGQHLYAGV